jgi:hypothetical protein
MKKYFLILTIILLSGCSTDYNVVFKQREISSMILYIVIDDNASDSGLCIEFPAKYNNQLKDIDYIGGWVKIGNELFTFDKNEIIISIVTASSPSAKFRHFLYEENGKLVISEEEKPLILHDCYCIRLYKDISKRKFNRIYKQENKNVETNFEYKVTVGDDIIEIIINENFTYYVEKRIEFLGEILLKEVLLE